MERGVAILKASACFRFSTDAEEKLTVEWDTYPQMKVRLQSLRVRSISITFLGV